MTRHKISKNFHVDEFVPPDIYEQWGKDSIRFIDNRIVAICQYLRELTGKPVYVNTWAQGGQYKDSGFRSIKSKTGTKTSQHRYGRAADVKVEGMKPKEVETLIMANKTAFMTLGLTRMEKTLATPTWNHLDCAYTGFADILIVNP